MRIKTSHVECGYCATLLVDTLQAFTEHDASREQNPLVKRIAELEAWKVAYLEWQETAAKLIERLQSQLAWTPVSEGLPAADTTDKWILLLANSDDPEAKWARFCMSPNGWHDGYENTPYDYIVDGYDVFRRIELPEAK